MDISQQRAAAEDFRARHQRPPVLLLPNAWDAMSARIFVSAGFEQIATTSAGVAWALGYPDGEVAPWAEIVAATARITRAAGVPVTADIEGAYAATPDEVGQHVGEIIAAGVVGINLEDSADHALRDEDDAMARLAAARAAADRVGVPIVINARCDVPLLALLRGEDVQDSIALTLARCRAYLEAGADCVYPFGLSSSGMIADFIQRLGAPVNVMGRPGMPSAAELEKLGVARITTASAATVAAVDAMQKMASTLFAGRHFDPLTSSIGHAEIQQLFGVKGQRQ